MYATLLVLSTFAWLAAVAPPPVAVPSVAMPVLQAPVRTLMPNDGITVRGAASINAPATSATLSLNVGTKDRSATLSQAALAPIIDALVQAGVDRNQIQLPVYFTEPVRTNFVTIKATVEHPTVAMIQRGIALLGSAFENAPALTLQSAMVQDTIADCAGLQRQAGDAALNDARVKARHIAAELHVQLGQILSVDDQSGGSAPCMSSYQLGPYGNMPESLSDFLDVRVYGNVVMRYAIK